MESIGSTRWVIAEGYIPSRGIKGIARSKATRPHEVDPLSAMPDLEVTEEIARDMAAYLYDIAAGDRGESFGQMDH